MTISKCRQDEIERLHVLNNVFNMTFDGRLLFPPLTRPRRILDCGYGTASWAIGVAEENPRCEVGHRHQHSTPIRRSVLAPLDESQMVHIGLADGQNFQ